MARKNDPFQTLLSAVSTLKASGVDLTAPQGVGLNGSVYPAYGKEIHHYEDTGGWSAYFKQPLENGTMAYNNIANYRGHIIGKVTHLTPGIFDPEHENLLWDRQYKGSGIHEWEHNYSEDHPLSEWSKKPLYGIRAYKNRSDEEMSPEELQNTMRRMQGHIAKSETRPHSIRYYHGGTDISDMTPWHEYNVKDETFKRKDPLEDMFNL
jgi:hypothetical protein